MHLTRSSWSNSTHLLKRVYLDSADVALLFRIMGDVDFVKSALDTVKGIAMREGAKYFALHLGASPQSFIIFGLVSF